jgi:predicted glycoside hydrolase/deacetylase ChbG (UPF0249 family)
LRLIINADDFGLSRGITDKILKSFDQGCLNSTSIMANGHAFDYSIEQLRARPSLRVSIHLNLVEGRALYDHRKLSYLTNEEGYFDKTFVTLVKTYCLLGTSEKKEMKEQITLEIEAQIEKVKAAIDWPVVVDSHHHTHVLPFIWDCLLSLHEKHQIKYIRMPREPFYFVAKNGHWGNYFSSNPCKLFLLNRLSKRCQQSLDGHDVQTPRYFVGVLFTGRMTADSVDKALKVISSRVKDDDLVEVLLHPGGAEPGEESFWQRYPDWQGYYYSENRHSEGQLLRDSTFHEIINRYRGISENFCCSG